MPRTTQSSVLHTAADLMTPSPPRPHLLPLDATHAPAVLAFERENRTHFAPTVGDRGEDYFDRFQHHHQARLAEQVAGTGAYYVVLDHTTAVMARINLVIDGADIAELGYRVAPRAAGRGLATAAVGEVSRIAQNVLGLRGLEAATSVDNVASQRVLLKAGFVRTGAADPADVGGRSGHRYLLGFGQTPARLNATS